MGCGASKSTPVEKNVHMTKEQFEEEQVRKKEMRRSQEERIRRESRNRVIDHSKKHLHYWEPKVQAEKLRRLEEERLKKEAEEKEADEKAERDGTQKKKTKVEKKIKGEKKEIPIVVTEAPNEEPVEAVEPVYEHFKEHPDMPNVLRFLPNCNFFDLAPKAVRVDMDDLESLYQICHRKPEDIIGLLGYLNIHGFKCNSFSELSSEISFLQLHYDVEGSLPEQPVPIDNIADETAKEMELMSHHNDTTNSIHRESNA